MWYWFLALPLVLIQMGGCSLANEQVHEFSIRIEDDIEYCTSVGGPKYDRPLFKYQELFTLEQDESRPETLIHGRQWQYNNSIMDDHGFVYFADEGNYRVTIYDDEGVFLRSLGREGRGPGEMMEPVVVGTLGNSVFVWDRLPSIHRMMHFAADGNLLDLQTFPYVNFTTDYVIPVHQDTLAFMSNVARFNGDVRYGARNISIITATGDSLGSIEASMEEELAPFQAHPSLTVTRNGELVMAMADEPVIHWFDSFGREQRQFRYQASPERVTRNERRMLKKAKAEVLKTAVNASHRDYLMNMANREIPEVKDWCGDVRIDDYGFTWTSETYAGWMIGDPSKQKMKVFSPSGEFLGYAGIPQVKGTGERFDLSRGRMILRYFDGASGAPTVKVFSILPNVEGLQYK